MSNLADLILGIAKNVGAPIIKGLLETATPGIVSDIGGKIIDQIAGKAGVSADQLPDLIKREPARVDAAVIAAESAMPEMMALWSKGVDGQFALLQAEAKEGFFHAGWRPATMWLIAALWSWALFGGPVANHFVRLPIELPDLGKLAWLTTVYMALYMGGHTVKSVAESYFNAFKGGRS
jgi:Holin of 3TMs, for gene-transfer release